MPLQTPAPKSEEFTVTYPTLEILPSLNPAISIILPVFAEISVVPDVREVLEVTLFCTDIEDFINFFVDCHRIKLMSILDLFENLDKRNKRY